MELSQNLIKIKQGELIYALNEEENTASIVGSKIKSNEILIPRSITYKTQEYLITSIEKESLADLRNLKSLQFPADSELRTIEQNAFSNSSIESLTIPPKVSELKPGWCLEAYNLKNVALMPNNPNFRSLNDIFILGKSDQKSDIFDVILFVNRSIKQVTIPPCVTQIGPYSFLNCQIESITIPPHITKICEYAFSRCTYLKSVEMPSDSELTEIENHAFFLTQIESIFIPSHVKKLSESIFESCSSLKEIKFPQNSELQTIERKAFALNSFDRLRLPASVFELKDGWSYMNGKIAHLDIDENSPYFKKCDEEGNITVGKSDPQSDEFDVIVFVDGDVTEITIPPSITQIGSYAFTNSKIESITIPPHITHLREGAFLSCRNLKSVEIPHDSNLQEIGKNCFSGARIKKLFIPRHITKLRDSIFLCSRIEKIEFHPDSELHTIEGRAFTASHIESLSISSKVTNLEEGWCYQTPNLKKIKIAENNPKYKNYEDYIIGKSDINSDKYDVLLLAPFAKHSFTIPSFITKIAPFAFAYTNIERIFIPPHVTHIGRCAFLDCKMLQRVEIPHDSQLVEIGDRAFCSSSIKSCYIPPHANVNCEMAFFLCFQLKIIEIDENFEMESIDTKKFPSNFNISIMVPDKDLIYN